MVGAQSRDSWCVCVCGGGGGREKGRARRGGKGRDEV